MRDVFISSAFDNNTDRLARFQDLDRAASSVTSRLFGKSLALAFPWLRRFLFERVVVMTGEKTLKKSPFKFIEPNILLIALFVVGLNALNFLIMWLHTEDKVFQLISVSGVSLVAVFFLLKGYAHAEQKRERLSFLVLIAVLYALFLLFLFGLDVWWPAFVVKVTIEVVFCAVVMLVELTRLNDAQDKAVDAVMRGFKISPASRVGRLLARLSTKRAAACAGGGDGIESGVEGGAESSTENDAESSAESDERDAKYNDEENQGPGNGK